MFELEALLPRAAAVVDRARALGVMIASAESCTGGLVSGLLTAVPGSSDVFERGFVTYSNAAKIEMLGVDAPTLARVGAVSSEVAQAMAHGALMHSRADLAVSITGIAGPGGGSPDKPVGLVHFGFARRPREIRSLERRFGDLGRDAVRVASVDQALRLVEEAIGLA